MLIEPKKKYMVESVQGKNWYLEGSGVEKLRYNPFRKKNRLKAEEAYKKNFDLPGPLHVIIETSSLCQLRCGFCNRDAGLARPQKNMGLDLFKKVADQCAEGGVHSLGLYALGEPFLNPDLRKMITYAKGIGIPYCDVSSNGMLPMAEVVLGTSLNEIIVSLDGFKETHEKLRPGSSWEKIRDNIGNLWWQRKRGNHQWPIIRLQIIDLPENHDKIPQFIDWGLTFADVVYVKRVESMRQSLGNRLIADDKANDLMLNRTACKQLYFCLTVTSSGDISACCHDGKNNTVLGNISEINIKDAWVKLAEIRQRHRMGDYSDFNGLCKNCTDYNW